GSGGAGPAGRLPEPLTPLIGRESEARETLLCLRAARLVTLTGPGGIGKTRLAIQVAQGVAEELPDGVWFADLAPLCDPTRVPEAAASVLGVRQQPGRSLGESLADFLRERHLLLILDNCEHLLSECARLAAALLQSCPGLRILVTS